MLSHKIVFNSAFLESTYSRIRRHIFIEEVILFPKLPPEVKDDVEYLEKEHGNILWSLRKILVTQDYKTRLELLQELYDLMVEHNSYEDSYVYDYFRLDSANALRQIEAPYEDWKSHYEDTFPTKVENDS